MAIDSISLNKNAMANLFTANSRLSLKVSGTFENSNETTQELMSEPESGRNPGQVFMKNVFDTLGQFGLLPHELKPSTGKLSNPASETPENSISEAERAKHEALHSFVHDLLQVLSPSGTSGSGPGNELKLQMQYSADIIVRVKDLTQQLSKAHAGDPNSASVEQLQAKFRKLVQLLAPDNAKTDHPDSGKQSIDLISFLDKLTANLRTLPNVGTELPNTTGNVVNTAA